MRHVAHAHFEQAATVTPEQSLWLYICVAVAISLPLGWPLRFAGSSVHIDPSLDSFRQSASGVVPPATRGDYFGGPSYHVICG